MVNINPFLFTPYRPSITSIIGYVVIVFIYMYTDEEAFDFFLLPMSILVSFNLGLYVTNIQSKKIDKRTQQEKCLLRNKNWYSNIAPRLMLNHFPSASQRYIFEKRQTRIAKIALGDSKKVKKRKPHRERKCKKKR